MDVPNDQPHTQVNSVLANAAEEPGVDPCDIACEAMPAHIVGDLTTYDEVWLHEHTADCNYCANELRRYNRLGEALAALGKVND